jgi:hypothetical protein
MYYDDAEVLAALMGYEEPEDDSEEEYDWKEEHKKYIEQRLSAFEVMKSLYEAENPTDVLKSLNAEKYLALLQDQEKLESVFKKAKKDSKIAKDSPDVAKAAEDDKPQIASEVKDKEVSTSVVNKSSKETKMTDKTQEVAAAEQVEMVEKAKVVDLQKALEAQQVELQKALETIKQFEAEKKAAIEKARLDQMKAAVKDEARAEVLFKAAKDASDADFEAVIKALSEMQVAVEKSDLFVEKGASAEDTKKDETESPVAKLLKAKYAAAAKK